MKTILLCLVLVLSSLVSFAQKGDSIVLIAVSANLNGEQITAPMNPEGLSYLTFTDSTMIMHYVSKGSDDKTIYQIKKKVSSTYFLVTDGIQDFVIKIEEMESRATTYDLLSGKAIYYYTTVTFTSYGQVVEFYYCSQIWH